MNPAAWWRSCVSSASGWSSAAAHPGPALTPARHKPQTRHPLGRPGSDPRRAAAYQQLGLAWGASRDAIKKAHRRLVKQHHPDVGGEAEAFRRVNDAYQLLMA